MVKKNFLKFFTFQLKYNVNIKSGCPLSSKIGTKVKKKAGKYSLHCTVYTVQCTEYTVYSTVQYCRSQFYTIVPNFDDSGHHKDYLYYKSKMGKAVKTRESRVKTGDSKTCRGWLIL